VMVLVYKFINSFNVKGPMEACVEKVEYNEENWQWQEHRANRYVF
jgi:hypothetical protein